MTFEQFIFYLLAAIAAFSGLMVISVKNPVKAALWLVLAFIATAGVWLTAQAEFLGLVLILVYVGAVMVLFLFVVMMLDINVAQLKEGFTRYLPLGALTAIAIFALMYMVLGPERFGLAQYAAPTANANAEDVSNTLSIAIPLYTEHAYPFILAAVLLLVGIVAAITLTLRRRAPGVVLYQDIDKQVKVQASDRFKMVKMAPVVEKDVPTKEKD
ncbi:MAG: NADH-quinone oxidoreductase subunit J [Hydrogenovibrio sp.]